ncbi:MAG TPA: hypothetical protein VHJ99_10260 [Candidatus Dormibacteraeota bacterium]|nr:hypothetical protein [Candidatus Dormibacteraeota bacterium]
MSRWFFVGIAVSCAAAGLIVINQHSSRENRLRRECERRGWKLQRRSDPRGTYQIVVPNTDIVVIGDGFAMDLERIEDFLQSDAASELLTETRRLR